MAEIKYRLIRIGSAHYTPRFTLNVKSTGNPTVTLIESEGKSILVDPGADPWLDERQEAEKLGEAIAKIRPPYSLDGFFITHTHADHCNLARYFQGIPILAGLGEIIPGVFSFPTPGHTKDHKSLEFQVNGETVIIAGDAVINEDFFTAPGYDKTYRANGYTKAEADETLRTIEEIRQRADKIIPGHGDIFSVK